MLGCRGSSWPPRPQKTGHGQKIDLSLLGGLMSSLTTRLATYWTAGEDPGRSAAPTVVMPYEAFATADGYAVAGVWGGDDGWKPFCDALDRDDLVEHPDFADNPLRVANRQALNAILHPIFADPDDGRLA